MEIVMAAAQPTQRYIERHEEIQFRSAQGDAE